MVPPACAHILGNSRDQLENLLQGSPLHANAKGVQLSDVLGIPCTSKSAAAHSVKASELLLLRQALLLPKRKPPQKHLQAQKTKKPLLMQPVAQPKKKLCPKQLPKCVL